MVIITMYRKINQLKKQGILIEEIHKRLKVSHKTIRKYLGMDDTYYTKYRREHLFRNKIFDSFKEEILSVYEANDNKELVMSSVYDFLEENHGALPGNEGSLRNYIHFLVVSKQLTYTINHREYIKVDELKYGKQMQLDFGEYKFPGGLKIYIFATLLSSSRYKYAAFQIKPFNTLDVIMHLLDSFDNFGGIPQELVIDQDKTMVVSENRGDIIYTTVFQDFIKEMGLEMYVCRKADPESKGKIESLVKFIKSSFLNCRDFTDIGDANHSLQKWLMRRANGKISQATKKVPNMEIEKEKLKLRPIRNSIHRKELQIGREDRIVDEKARIFIQGSHYVLPQFLKKQTVQVYITERECFVYDNISNTEIARYELSLIPGKVIKLRGIDRETGKKLDILKEKAFKLSNSPAWIDFLTATFKDKKRYVRDQCVDAVRYFSSIDNEKALSDGIAFCMENETFSMAQLRDTYLYFKKVKSVIPLKQIPILSTHKNIRHQMPEVEYRSLKEYQNVIEEKIS